MKRRCSDGLVRVGCTEEVVGRSGGVSADGNLRAVAAEAAATGGCAAEPRPLVLAEGRLAGGTTGALEGAFAVGNGWTQTMSEQQLIDCDTMRSGCDGGRPMVCTSMDLTICRRKFVAQMVNSSKSLSERHWKLGKMVASFSQGGNSSRSSNAPNHGGDFDTVGAVMSIDETLVCSFKVLKPAKDKRYTHGILNGRLPADAGLVTWCSDVFV